MSYLVLVSDDDAHPTGERCFSNIRVYEAGSTPASLVVTRSVAHAYDSANRWIGRDVDSDGEAGSAAVERTFFLYDGGQITLELSHTGVGNATAADLTHRYLWGPAVDQILADEQVDDLTTPGTALWPLTDHLGTVRDLVGNSGQLENHIQYDAFGNVVAESNGAVDHRVGFTARPFDEAPGLQNNLNRWYAPETGCWLSEDPIGFAAGGASLSPYVGNGPSFHLARRRQSANYVSPARGGWIAW